MKCFLALMGLFLFSTGIDSKQIPKTKMSKMNISQIKPGCVPLYSVKMEVMSALGKVEGSKSSIDTKKEAEWAIWAGNPDVKIKELPHKMLRAHFIALIFSLNIF